MGAAEERRASDQAMRHARDHGGVDFGQTRIRAVGARRAGATLLQLTRAEDGGRQDLRVGTGAARHPTVPKWVKGMQI